MSSERLVSKLSSLLLTGFILLSCTPANRYTTDTAPKTPRSRYYRTGSVVEKNLPPSGEEHKTGKVFNWTASFYGEKFHGRKTANGEIYDMNAMTCAHRELPFNTVLRVTNPDNNLQVSVRVNDRGPFIRGRDIDLSYGAAESIGMIDEGTKVLQIEILQMGE